MGPPAPRTLRLLQAGIEENPPAGIRQALKNATASLIARLASLPLRVGKRLFAMNDAEAGWRGWDTTVLAAGLARRYRDPQFDTRRNQLESPCAEKDTRPSQEAS